MPDCHKDLSLPPLRGGGSGSHVFGSTDDMSWQLSEQGKRETVPTSPLATPPDPSWQYFGDPADVAEALDLDAVRAHVRRTLLDRIVGASAPWREHAACAGADLDLFFPARGQSSAPAFGLCGRCDVRAECLDEALADESLDFGVRGGLSAPARKARRKLDAKRGGES